MSHLDDSSPVAAPATVRKHSLSGMDAGGIV